MVVEHQAHDDYFAGFLRLDTEAETETMKPLLCHTDTLFYGCWCRTVGKVIVSLLLCRWVDEGCHEPGSNNLAAIPTYDAIQSGSVSLEVGEEG